MSIQAINVAERNSVEKFKKPVSMSVQSKANNQPSFQGLEVFPIAVADMLYRGGYMTSFILQDFVGMAAPRVAEGLNRRPINPETGKKEGPYNWKFARREGIREVLSGPSAYVIPLVCLHFIKKYSGKANNVPINMIQGLGNNFVDYAANNKSTLGDVAKTRKDFYNQIFRNVLNTTLNGQMSEEDLAREAREFAEKAIEIEQSKDKSKSFIATLINKKVPDSPQDLTDSLTDRFMKLKKKYLNPSTKEMNAEITIFPEKTGLNPAELTESDKAGVGFKKLLKSMTDFTDDVIESTGKAIEKYKNTEFDAKRYLNDFVLKRTGSRILSNIGMWSAVVAFYMIIPTLYSIGLKGQNPSFANDKGANQETTNDKPEAAKEGASSNNTSFKGKNVAFTGKESLFKGTAEKVLKSDKLKSFINKFEFDDAAMTVSGMMALLFGFCLPTRMIKAPDKYDFNETIARDLASFSAILFGAQALSRGLSVLFTKLSGLALNIRPKDHGKNIFTTFKNYFWPIGGIDVLSNKELASKYTNIHEYKDGINGFFDFITANNGNLKKLLKMDKTVAENAKIILGKDLEAVTGDKEIKEAFKNITSEAGQKAKEVIENVFKDSKNKFVKSAKLYNSTFTFLSTVFLVPGFMVWLARTCERMTRNARARDNEKLAAQVPLNNAPKNLAPVASAATSPSPANKITMQGFLAK